MEKFDNFLHRIKQTTNKDCLKYDNHSSAVWELFFTVGVTIRNVKPSECLYEPLRSVPAATGPKRV